MNYDILIGDVRDQLKTLEDGSVQTVVTSPPYWGLRDYGNDGQIGLEKSPQEYVANMVEVFGEVWRVLADDGTLWLNIGDSYSSVHTGGHKSAKSTVGANHDGAQEIRQSKAQPKTYGLKNKELVGIPWRLAFALQDAGWYLRQDIIWAKPNPMPESVKDRCTKSHEYIFLLTKSPKYYFDNYSIKEPAVSNVGNAKIRFGGNKYGDSNDPKHATKSGNVWEPTDTRNKRDVWSIPTKPFKGAHFAVMPEALVEPCILAGSYIGDTVLDPFAGSGTVGVVALKHGRKFIGVELNPEYAQIAHERISLANL